MIRRKKALKRENQGTSYMNIANDNNKKNKEPIKLNKG